MLFKFHGNGELTTRNKHFFQFIEPCGDPVRVIDDSELCDKMSKDRKISSN